MYQCNTGSGCQELSGENVLMWHVGVGVVSVVMVCLGGCIDVASQNAV